MLMSPVRANGPVRRSAGWVKVVMRQLRPRMSARLFSRRDFLCCLIDRSPGRGGRCVARWFYLRDGELCRVAIFSHNSSRVADGRTSLILCIMAIATIGSAAKAY